MCESSQHTQDKPMVERHQPVSSCRKHRKNKGLTTEFSGNLHSPPFDSSFITVRRVRKKQRGSLPRLTSLSIFKSWCDLLLGSADAEVPAPYSTLQPACSIYCSSTLSLCLQSLNIAKNPYTLKHISLTELPAPLARILWWLRQ